MSLASGGPPSSAEALVHVRCGPAGDGGPGPDTILGVPGRGTLPVSAASPNRERALLGGSCAVAILGKGHIDDLEGAADPLALDDDIDRGVNQFADVGAGEIAAAVAFFDQ